MHLHCLLQSHPKESQSMLGKKPAKLAFPSDIGIFFFFSEKSFTEAKVVKKGGEVIYLEIV